MTLEQKIKQDRKDYETLCRLNKIYTVLKSCDWYPDFNRLKCNLSKNGK